MRGSRVFYVSAYLFLSVIVSFLTFGIISPPAGVQGQPRNMGLGQRGLDTKLAYSAFGLLSFRERGREECYAVQEWDGSPDTLWAATNCREKRGR